MSVKLKLDIEAKVIIENKVKYDFGASWHNLHLEMQNDKTFEIKVLNKEETRKQLIKHFEEKVDWIIKLMYPEPYVPSEKTKKLIKFIHENVKLETNLNH